MKTNPLEKIGNYLLERRKRIGARTTDIQTISGLSIGNISRVEDSLAGKTKVEPSLSVLGRYSSAMGVKLMINAHVTRALAVYNRGGGEGKTTTTVNLAYCLAQKGYRVLVVDGDPQSSITMLLGLNKRDVKLRQTIFETLNENAPLPNAYETKWGFWLIPACRQLSNADKISNVRAVHALKNQLKTTTEWDYVLIDTPPVEDGILITSLMTAVEAIILATTMTGKGEQSFEDVLNLIEDTRDVNPNLQLRIITPTKFDKESATERDLLNVMQKNSGTQFVISDPIRLTNFQARAAKQNKPILAYLNDPDVYVNETVKDGIRQDYEKLAELVIQNYPTEPKLGGENVI
jgi:chromosome partitioning protein